MSVHVDALSVKITRQAVHLWWVKPVIYFHFNKAQMLFFSFPGGTEQEVSAARHPDPTVRGHVHLHQRPHSVHEGHALAGPLRHHPHHLRASDAGGLHAPGFHRRGLGLQVRLWWRCDVEPVMRAVRQKCKRSHIIQLSGLGRRCGEIENTAVLWLFRFRHWFMENIQEKQMSVFGGTETIKLCSY